MKIYCLIRKTDTAINGASTQVACYSSLENAEEVSLDLIIEKVMINVQNTIHSQTYLETSGDIAYIVAYLEKYKGLIVELENIL